MWPGAGVAREARFKREFKRGFKRGFKRDMNGILVGFNGILIGFNGIFSWILMGYSWESTEFLEYILGLTWVNLITTSRPNDGFLKRGIWSKWPKFSGQ